MNKYDKNDEAAEMMISLSTDTVIADETFRSELKKKVVGAYNAPTPSYNYLVNRVMYALTKRKALAGGGIVALGLVAVVGLYSFSSRGLSPADKSASEIFSAMLTANQNKVAADTASTDGDRMTAELSSLIAFVEPKTYEIYGSVSVAGAASAQCSGYLPYGISSSSESYSYTDEASNRYYKYIVRDTNGQIINYSLGVGEDTYEYSGGQFAVKQKNLYTLMDAISARSVETDSVSVDEPVTSEDDAPVDDNGGGFRIEDHFGPDAQVLGQENLNGRPHYVVTWSYDGYCGTDAVTRKVVYKNWVDAEAFVYRKEEIYLDSISAANLVVTNTYTGSKRIAEFSEVSAQFVFDVGVTVREVDTTTNIPGTESYTAAVRQVLSGQQIQLPKPTGYSFNYVGASRLGLPDPNAFRLERAFYAPGANGDKLFAEAQEIYAVDEATLTYLSAYFTKQEGENYYNVSIDIYGQDMSDAELQERVRIGEGSTSTVTLQIGGQAVNATLYEGSYEQSTPSSEGGVTDASCPDCKKSYSLSFVLGDHKYTMFANGFDSKAQMLATVFSTIDSGNATGIEELMAEFAKIEEAGSIIAL